MPEARWANNVGRYPYATEMFGSYRPMIGWSSRRKLLRLALRSRLALSPILDNLTASYRTGNEFENSPHHSRLEVAEIGSAALVRPAAAATAGGQGFFLTRLQQVVAERIAERGAPQSTDEWSALVDEDAVRSAYGDFDRGAVNDWMRWSDSIVAGDPPRDGEDETTRRVRLFERTSAVLDDDSRLAAAVLDLSRRGSVDVLRSILPAGRSAAELGLDLIATRSRDPFADLDPRSGLKNVSLSPLGIVHFFRQYFFELDTFLGPAVGHVWLAPGSTVELVESSTRRRLTESITEIENESTTTTATESNTTDEISGAVHSENRSDSKLGFSTTVNQSWPLGDMSATASIDLDRTQQEARETTHRRMREQSQKISNELRKRYATTFKTVSEVTDTSSRRYVISNPSETDLQNYELRRKMRRIAVQVQDVGTYLCWETFVEEPGAQLGLANLVHVAKSPDVAPVPPAEEIPVPPAQPGVGFELRVFWEGRDVDRPRTDEHGISLGKRDLVIAIPDGYEVAMPVGTPLGLRCQAVKSDDPGGFESYTYTAVFRGGRTVEVYLALGAGKTMNWDKDIHIDLRGEVTLDVTKDRREKIGKANEDALARADAARRAAQAKADEQAFYVAAQERIETAASITPRRFEDLREEERTIVYRNLIAELMAGESGSTARNYDVIDPPRRHVYAAVIDAIFDVDRMLFFVAPEWWRPRARTDLRIGDSSAGALPAAVTTRWDNGSRRDSDYHITGSSRPARLGSSLGWLLQLDGDDQRNRFLNAPWVRAVMPVRPGREQAAFNWLTRADVEGSEGLDRDYLGEPAELAGIRVGLQAAGQPCSDPPTISDAIRFLSLRVAEKHRESTVEKLFPDRPDMADSDKVWATPLDKVFEFGFDPTERSFRADPLQEPADGASTNFQVMAQWTEVVPTDQIVPVPVQYDPVTGRQRGPVQP